MIISNLPPLVKNQTCAVSGHRVLTSNFNEEQLKNDLTKIIDKGYTSDKITEELINEHLDLPECPDVDLLIRTGGEQRLSNYLLWHVAYAEQVYTNTLWPDYNEAEFISNIENFTKRNRRFGAEK